MTGGIQLFDLTKFRLHRITSRLPRTLGLSGMASSSINNQTGWAGMLVLIIVVWSALVAGSLAWYMHLQQQSVLDTATAAARANIHKDQGFRKWAATHGGVYVPPTEHTSPNPYLKVPDRDVATTTGKTLTLMNPAYMLRQMQSDFPGDFGTRSHLTSLKPINPDNAPDAWEAKALHTFEQGGKELLEAQQIDGQPYLRMMLPLVVEQGCLKCHEQQGYKLGDIRGGISTAVPMTPFMAREREIKDSLAISHGVVWLLGLAGLAWLGVSFRRVQRLEILSSSAAAVEKSERRFRAVAESANDAIINADSASKVVDWNPSAERLFGYTKAEIIGQPLTVLMPERFRDLHNAGLARVAAGGTPHVIGKTVELAGLRKDGSEFPLELSLAQWQTAEGRFFTAIIRDITERKQAEKLLGDQLAEIRRAKLEWQAVFDSISQPIFLHDDGFRVTRANKAYAEAAGLDVGDVIGQPYWEVFPRREGPMASCTKAQQSHKEESEEFGVDGKIYHTRAFFAEYISGEQYSVHILDDITERKKAEAELQGMLGSANQSRRAMLGMIEDQKRAEAKVRKLNAELEEKVIVRTAALEQANIDISKKEEEIRSVVDHMLDCVITIDERGIIRSANPAVEKIFGYTHDEVIGKNVSMLMPEPDRSAHDGYLDRYMHTDRPRIVGIEREVEGLHKNGERIALDLGVSEYIFQGQRYFTGILRDVCERMRIMADLEQARNNAEQANRAKSAFLSAMSHEIRTPMNGVVGMIDVLQQSNLTGPQIEMANIIHDSAFVLLAIIDDILDFSKIEAGKLQIDYAPISVAGAVEGACESLIPLALKKGVELTLFTDPSIPSQVMGDAGRLRQILVNLANNAIKFSSGQERQGKVSVRAVLVENSSHITVRPDPSAELRTKGVVEGLCGSPFDTSGGSPRTVEGNLEQATLEFRVTDNGIGIDKETQKRLFSPFTQADSTTTRNFGGTGLGLAISRQLANIMGGEITVRSEPGKGSLFSVRLPFKLLPDVGRDLSRQVGLKPDLQKTDLLAELPCLVADGSGSLADDLAAYLVHAGAMVERVAGLAAVKQWIASCLPGLYVVVIDTEGVNQPLDDLRAVARAKPGIDIRFVAIERGGRRHCRIVATDLIALDAEVMHRRAFLDAVAIASGRAKQPVPEAPSGDTNAAPAPLSREDARQQGRLILVAEDNEINQKVILQQLKLLGRIANIADDGREALELWRGGNYGLLFTDLHMPRMDGYELTTAIRTAEKTSDAKTRTPIIAITANALKGEADHCRAIGMDDYLSKPVQLANLKAMLEKWMPVVSSDPIADEAVSTTGSSTGSSLEPAQSLPPCRGKARMGVEQVEQHESQVSTPSLTLPLQGGGNVVVDVNVLKALIGDDEATIREFLHDFRLSAAKIAAELRAVCAAGETATAGAHAHKLKSSSRSVGALALGELCAEMEKAGKAGDIAALAALLPKFEQELASVEHFLDGY